MEDIKIDIPQEWLKYGPVTLYVPDVLSDQISIHRKRLNPEASKEDVIV